MTTQKAKIRSTLEELPFVSATWLEWSLASGGWEKTLVIEVTIDTDPNAHEWRNNVAEIEKALEAGATTMAVHAVRVVPAKR